MRIIKLSILLVLFYVVISNTPLKLKHIENSKFELSDSSVIEFPCKYGGKPVAIWAVEENSSIDSSKPIPPAFIAQGYEASDFTAKEGIVSDHVGTDGFHVNQQNPANGNVHFWLRRDKPFYVSTVLLSSPQGTGEETEKMVNNYLISTGIDHFQHVVPTKSHSFVLRTGVFIFRETETLHVDKFSWDENIEWSNFHQEHIKDIFYKMSPTRSSTHIEPNGFWICAEEPEDVTMETKEVKKLMALVEYEDIKEKEPELKFLK